MSPEHPVWIAAFGACIGSIMTAVGFTAYILLRMRPRRELPGSESPYRRYRRKIVQGLRIDHIEKQHSSSGQTDWLAVFSDGSTILVEDDPYMPHWMMDPLEEYLES